MYNQNIFDTINNYLTSSKTEKTIETYILTILEKLALENVICLHIEDNTMNGIDKKKNSWRTHFVNLDTEEDFYIEVLKTSFGLFESRCFYFDDNDNSIIIDV